MLKNHIMADLMRKPLINKVAERAHVSTQSIRLWVQKKDIRLLSYPLMQVMAEHYQCQINDLLEN